MLRVLGLLRERLDRSSLRRPGREGGQTMAKRPPRRATSPKPRTAGHAAHPAPDRDTHYQDLFEHTTDAVVLFTLDGRIEAVNRGAERLLGWAREELLGHPLRQIATPAS